VVSATKKLLDVYPIQKAHKLMVEFPPWRAEHVPPMLGKTFNLIPCSNRATVWVHEQPFEINSGAGIFSARRDL